MKVLLVNGIYSTGEQSVWKLGYELKQYGYEVTPVVYPMATHWSSRWKKRQLQDAEHFANHYEEGDAVIAHSYGCLITWRAMEIGARFSSIFYFSAAMPRNVYFPPTGMHELYNIYHPRDWVLKLGALMPLSWFGKLGYEGYHGMDPRVENVSAKISGRETKSHGRYFDDASVGFWASYVHQCIGGGAS